MSKGKFRLASLGVKIIHCGIGEQRLREMQLLQKSMLRMSWFGVGYAKIRIACNTFDLYYLIEIKL
jgi:hypothetical protein